MVMRHERRTIKVSLLTGLTDIIVGLILYFTGVADWYYSRFHVFGVLGMGFIIWAAWHYYFYKKEVGYKIW